MSNFGREVCLNSILLRLRAQLARHQTYFTFHVFPFTVVFPYSKLAILCSILNMLTLLGPDFVPLVVTQADLTIASIAFGWTLGFGFLTTWTAIQQTITIKRRYGISKQVSPYVWMIWLEILCCLVFAVICILHLLGVIPPSFAFFFCILTSWSLQVQLLLQIIINRVSILLTDRRKARRIKIGVAVLITAINISVYNIWIPARLQISPRYVYINDIWDRCEKVIFLCVDAVLNWYFIHTVRKNLVRKGLTKYNALVRFNMSIVSLSLAMDCLIIGMMSLSNTFVYMQIHPLAYIVKLNIEMSMTELMARVSTSGNSVNITAAESIFVKTSPSTSSKERSTASDNMRKYIPIQAKTQTNAMDTKLSNTFGATTDVKLNWIVHSDAMLDGILGRSTSNDRDIAMHMRREVNVLVERRNSLAPSFKQRRGSDGTEMSSVTEDCVEMGDKFKLLEQGTYTETAGGEETGERMGVHTKVWALKAEDEG